MTQRQRSRTAPRPKKQRTIFTDRLLLVIIPAILAVLIVVFILTRPQASTAVTSGEEARAAGNFTRAMTEYNRAIQLDPQYAPAYHFRGLALYQQGDYPTALADLSRALELAPQDADIYASRALVYVAQGALDAAIADSTRGIELDPSSAGSYYARGRAYQSSDQLDKAQPDLLRAIELNATTADYYLWLAEIYYDQTRYAEALENYRQYVALGGPGDYAQQRINDLVQRVGG